jgi:hypothetical protein
LLSSEQVFVDEQSQTFLGCAVVRHHDVLVWHEDGGTIRIAKM